MAFEARIRVIFVTESQHSINYPTLSDDLRFTDKLHPLCSQAIWQHIVSRAKADRNFI